METKMTDQQDKLTRVLAALRAVVEAGKTQREVPWRFPFSEQEFSKRGYTVSALYLTLAANLGDKVGEGLIRALK